MLITPSIGLLFKSWFELSNGKNDLCFRVTLYFHGLRETWRFQVNEMVYLNGPSVMWILLQRDSIVSFCLMQEGSFDGCSKLPKLSILFGCLRQTFLTFLLEDWLIQCSIMTNEECSLAQRWSNVLSECTFGGSSQVLRCVKSTFSSLTSCVEKVRA